MGAAWGLIMAALAAALASALPAAAQERQAAEAGPQQQPVYDIVAADRETAWRINRVTGEITVCRVDTAASLDGVRARCTPAIHDRSPQQAQTPPDGGINRP